jgi:Cft2 family RNA processing exonuclease
VSNLTCYSYASGHAGEGICLLLEIGNYRILLDCGLADHALVSQDDAIDLVLCSHAHADHARGLPAFHQSQPKTPLYATEVTAQLLSLQGLADGACQALPWRSPIEVLPNLTIELIPAGHLPGAAAILLTDLAESPPIRILYTGDFYLSNSRLVEGLRLAELQGLNPDVLLIEGSYGLQRRPHRRQQENLLMERIDRAIASGQSVLLPAASLGLGQELLVLLRSHHLFSGRDVNIAVAGAVAQTCDLYTALLPYFPIAVQNFARHQPLFWDEKIRPYMNRWDNATAVLEKPILDKPILDKPVLKKPEIIVTDFRSDLSQFCRSGDWLVLLPESSQQHQEWITQQPQPEMRSNAVIQAETYWLSEHNDGNATLQFIHSLRPQHIVWVHGDPDRLTELANLEELSNRYKVHLAQTGRLLELAIGKVPIPNAPAEVRYEGEVAETTAEVALSLPLDLTADPRWQAFAATGIVEAYWQGEALVLQGLSPSDVMGRIAAERSHQSTCSQCRYYTARRCTHKISPLYGLAVTPDGCCPEFQA